MATLDKLKEKLQAGGVYRRADLEKWSNSIDRHLKELVAEQTLVKLSTGLYYHPKETAFGKAPPTDEVVVKAFLKDDRFLITSPNDYNALGVGTTQLYNSTVVYNHKRHGLFSLGNRVFDFRMKPHFPLKADSLFLLVDLVNNINTLAENQAEILSNVRKKALTLDREKLLAAIYAYGGTFAKKFFADVLEAHELKYVG